MRQLNYQLKQLCQRNRNGSHATQRNRERIRTLVADQLHVRGYRGMSATSLKPEHIEALVTGATGDAVELATRESESLTH